MKTLLTAIATVAVVFLLLGTGPVASFAQCFLNCPAGDGGFVGPGAGNKSPDLSGDGVVDLVDLAIFSFAWPPNPYNYCADYDCTGFIDLVDFAVFALHWTHAGVPGFCQPGVDHYKPYEVLGGPTFTGPITLTDQFGSTDIDVMVLTKLATPVSKNYEAILDTIAHQTWWEFLFPEPPRMIMARDQFGEKEWMLGDSRFLIVPALKNPQSPNDPLPILNHYKCYDAFGPTLAIPVTLIDQFEQTIVVVLDGKYFCNPVQKTTPDGNTYAIVDSLAHLTCYWVDNPRHYGFGVVVRDQFVETQLVIDQNLCLCLPALKTQVFPPGSSEWKRIKALYE